MKQFLFSIVIPCRNSVKTINRLLMSMFSQKKKDDYEIIIVDDGCTDNTLKICHEYDNVFNMRYITTARKVHCPANSKQAGLEAARGKWITFIDHDDIFLPSSFENIRESLKNNNQYYLATYQRIYKDDLHHPLYILGSDSFLHGKWYSVDFLRSTNIHFQVDTAEDDIIFNKRVKATLIGNNIIEEDYKYAEYVTYGYIINDDNVTSQFLKRWGDVQTPTLKDHLQYAVLGELEYLKKYPHCKKVFVSDALSDVLKSFLMTQYSLWKGRTDLYVELYDEWLTVKRRLNTEFEVSDEEIIKTIYNYPEEYEKMKNNISQYLESFIELQSFRDFWISLKEKT